MKRYEKYKDSGVKWIGEIPEEWNVRRLKFSCELIQEKTVEKNSPYIALENIESYSGRLLSVSTSEPEGTCNRYKTNDVLFSKLRPYLTKCILAPSEGKCSSELLVLRDFEGDSKYLQYLFLSVGFIEYIDASTYGAKMPRANWQFIGNSYIPLPVYSEQQSIVFFLDKKTSQIDRFISEAEKEIEKLNELKQAQIAHWVTKGLNPNVPMKDSGIAWIGKIPEHWEVKRIAMLFSENKKKNVDYEFNRALKFNYGNLIPKDEKGDVLDLKDTYIAYTKIKKNDIAINCLNLNYDFVSQHVAIAKENGILTSAYLIVTPRSGVNADFYNYFFKAMDNKKLFHGMGTGIRLTLSYTELKKQYVLTPPSEEQKVIVSEIEMFINKINTLTLKLTDQIEYLKELKQRIISDAVTGKIDVRGEMKN